MYCMSLSEMRVTYFELWVGVGRSRSEVAKRCWWKEEEELRVEQETFSTSTPATSVGHHARTVGSLQPGTCLSRIVKGRVPEVIYWKEYGVSCTCTEVCITSTCPPCERHLSQCSSLCINSEV